MQTINNRMTETQIADLFSLAVQLQVKAEESDDRDTAILAYSIQNACSNLTESQREFRAADATIHNLELKLTDMAVQLANVESKCRELSAENVWLKNFIINDCHVAHIEPETFYEEEVTRYVSADGYESETPATDAFLAEVRAQGVEMAITVVNDCSNNICAGGLAENRQYEESIVNPYLDGIHDELQEIAAQLRKGATL
ncbi:hypothetical protein [Salmonella enterica]|uniref:hypothetical protein n=1 Tax=Salmonella enterica TaxID=28901 RepID=UPI001EE85162|nr:hypothetical protein [Salmonella enterica]